LHLPEWTTTFVTALFIIAFPFVLLFSWIYEITPKGLKRTKEVPLSKSITHLTGKRLNYIIMGLLVVALGYFVFDKYFIGHGAVETVQAPVVTETAKTQKTIAVLPFTDLSPAKDQEYFVDGLSEEILNSLTKIPDLLVTARTSSFAFKGKDKTVQEIAGVLGVDNILEGSVRKAGNALRISAQLIRAKDSFHLWSNTYDRELKDIFAVQEDIASAVADELKVTLGIDKPLKQLGGTENLEAYELYLIAIGQAEQDSNLSLKSLEKALVLDPNFALAWARKAYAHEQLSIRVPSNQQAIAEYDAGLNAAKKAIELEPKLAQGYAALGSINSTTGNWTEAELVFRKAIELGTESSLMPATYSQYLFSVGYFQKANKFNEEARQTDPNNGGVRINYMMSFGLLGDRQGAENEIEHLRAYLGDQAFRISYKGFATQVRLGLGESVSKDDISSLFPFGHLEIDLQKSEENRIKLRQFYSNNKEISVSNLNHILLIAARLGDSEFAMDLIEKLVSSNPKTIFFSWFPIMKEVRQTPRFKALVKKIGLVDYWNKFGWPDICRQLDNGDFECD